MFVIILDKTQQTILQKICSDRMLITFIYLMRIMQQVCHHNNPALMKSFHRVTHEPNINLMKNDIQHKGVSENVTLPTIHPHNILPLENEMQLLHNLP